MSDLVTKSFSLPETIDPNHTYVYRSGFGGLYRYWYVDQGGNYWEYTNAPEDSPEFESSLGPAILVAEQATPTTAPQFYAKNGKKLHAGVPQGVEIQYNGSYNPHDPEEVWYGVYDDPETGAPMIVYLDADIRENPELMVQYGVRLADSGITQYRSYANYLYTSANLKDKVVGAFLMLVDQGMYSPKELTRATVGDVVFIDSTVKLLGRKFVCDTDFYDFITSIVAGRDDTDVLFKVDTHLGEEPLGDGYVSSLFYSMRMEPDNMLVWAANCAFVRIVHRLLLQQTPADIIEERAYEELSQTFSTVDDLRYMILSGLHTRLIDNYELAMEEAVAAQGSLDDEEAVEAIDEQQEAPQEGVEDVVKSIAAVDTDSFGVATVTTSLKGMRDFENNFSQWLHYEPMHQVSDSLERYLIDRATGEPEEGQQDA